jgi:hypothetical protein
MDKSTLLLVWAFVMAVVEALGQIVSALHFLLCERLPWAVTAPDRGARRNGREPAPNPPRHRGKGFLFWAVVGLGAALTLMSMSRLAENHGKGPCLRWCSCGAFLALRVLPGAAVSPFARSIEAISPLAHLKQNSKP